MPPSNDERPADDLDLKIAERTRDIALNAGDARAHRDRGLFRARKQDFDEAMVDFDQAIALDPADAHSYGLRGLVWDKKGDSGRAITDFDKAIALAPANVHVYQAHRDRVALADPTGADERLSAKRPVVAGGDVNLLENPFVILGVSPTATSQDVKYAYEDALEDGVESEEVLLRSQQTLLTPRLRIDAEVSGFLDIDPGLASSIVAAVRAGKDLDGLSVEALRIHALPKSNLIAHFGSAQVLGEIHLLELIEAQATVAPGSACDAINDNRESAGGGKVDREAVTQALARLEERQIRATVGTICLHQDSWKSFGNFVDKVIATGDDLKITKLDGYVQAFVKGTSAERSRRSEAVISACEAVRNNSKDDRALAQLTTSLEDWNASLTPAQAFESYMHREDTTTREMYDRVRELMLSLANDKNEFETAGKIVAICLGVFEDLPRAVEQLREDDKKLVELRNEQLAETLLGKLALVCEGAQKRHRELEKDLLRDGFGPRSKGLAGSLYAEFAGAIASTQGLPFSDVPWRFVRNIAISLNNDSEAPAATAVLVDGLIACITEDNPSSDMAAALRADKRTARKNFVENELGKSLTANKHIEALQHIDELLTLETDASTVETLRAARKGVADKQRSKRNAQWGWGIAAAVVVVLLVANSGKEPAYAPSPVSRTQTTQAPAPVPAPSTPSVEQARTPDYSEDRPAPGSNGAFSQANLRYCSFQAERLEAARKLISTDAERLPFNAAIEDLNSRCSDYRYRPSDKQVVDAQTVARTSVLEAEARALVATWRPKASPAAPDAVSAFTKRELKIASGRGTLSFSVGMASIQQPQAWQRRGAIPWDGGMLYVYQTPKIAVHTMKDIPIPLDVVFIDATGTVTQIATSRKAMTDFALRSSEPAIAMLELNAGIAAQAGIAVGDTVSLAKSADVVGTKKAPATK
jgi:uncharacterized membrane protein (UPF0127 family)/tetratricopeptide (TPR) repeat protein